MKNETFLTVSEAARRKGVSRTTIYKAIAQKRLPAQEMLGRTAVKESALMATDLGTAKGGRPAGKSISKTHKAAIGAGQKRRWQSRQKKAKQKEAKPKAGEANARKASR